jgi:hypothetical protein
MVNKEGRFKEDKKWVDIEQQQANY